MTNDPKRETAENSTPAQGEGAPPSRLNRHVQMLLDHLWGPTGSVILHILIVVLLVRFVTGLRDKRASEIEVLMVDPDTRDLEDLKKELEKIKDIEVDIRPPDADIVMDQPVETPMNAPIQEDLAALDIRQDAQSPLIMRSLFAGRTAEGRAALGRRFGGRTFGATEAAVLRALEWLKEHQLEDGSWSGEDTARSKTAMTGLALLTFLAHGETTTSERYGATVRRAIDFLVDTDWKGDRFQNVDDNWYGHGIATYALCEAYALTRMPKVKVAAEQALTRILQGQQETGAFNYRLRSSDSRRDSSVMGWMNQAMKAGYIANLDVPGLKEAMEKGINGYKLNFDPAKNMFAYAPQGGVDNGRLSNTAMGVLVMQLLGHGNDPEAKAGFESLRGMSADYHNPQGLGNHPLYVWYYATQAHFHASEKDWNEWNNRFARSFVAAQNADGSWTPPGGETKYGPVYGTTFAALSLMVYYRFLPTYQPVIIEEAPTAPADDGIKIEVS